MEVLTSWAKKDFYLKCFSFQQLSNKLLGHLKSFIILRKKSSFFFFFPLPNRRTHNYLKTDLSRTMWQSLFLLGVYSSKRRALWIMLYKKKKKKSSPPEIINYLRILFLANPRKHLVLLYSCSFSKASISKRARCWMENLIPISSERLEVYSLLDL